MGASLHIYGIKPPDDKWTSMEAVWRACTDAGIEIPDKVEEYFDYSDPTTDGVVVLLGHGAGGSHLEYDLHESITPFTDDIVSGGEIDLTKLPKDITQLRVVNV